MSIRVPRARRMAGLVMTAAVIELTLTTAYIHYSLGGLLFTLNAAGYAVLAAGMALTAAVRGPSSTCIRKRPTFLPSTRLSRHTGTAAHAGDGHPTRRVAVMTA